MSEKLRSTDTKLSKIKRLFIEQLWLILLFAPLLIIALFVGKHYLSNTDNSPKNRSVASIAIQITSAELSAIIAKPLSELVLVEVYFDAKGKGRNQTAALDTKVDEALSEVILISQYDDMLDTQVSAQVLSKENNNNVGEHS